jgi:hypothetical protein
MVCIKHTARPKVLLETAPMASGDETEVPSRQREVSPDTLPLRSLDDSGDCESRSGSSRGTTSESDESSCDFLI